MTMKVPARITFLIVACGVLAMAGVFDSAMPATDAWRHDRQTLSSPLHVLALASIILSLWPAVGDIWSAAQRRRVHWAIVGVIVTTVACLMFGPMVGALSALSCSIASLLVVGATQD